MEGEKMNDEKLIEMVRQYPVLYDLGHTKYMDTTHKFNIWNKVASEMKTDVSLCKTRWNNIRDNYRKSIKKTIAKSGQSSKKVKLYKYSEQLRFLKKYFNESFESLENAEEGDKDYRTAQEGMDHHTEEEENWKNDVEKTNELNIDDNLSTDASSTFIDLDTATTSVKPKKRKLFINKAVAQESASSRLMAYLINKQEITNASAINPVDAFLAGITPTLKSLHPYYLNLAKSEIFATVQKYEMQMLTGQNPFDESPHFEQPSSSPASAFTPLISLTEQDQTLSTKETARTSTMKLKIPRSKCK